MKQNKKQIWARSILEIILILWITLTTATWIILNTYEKIGNSSSLPENVRKQITSAGEHINRYVWRQYKYAEQSK
jgi:hypothetical protein